MVKVEQLQNVKKRVKMVIMCLMRKTNTLAGNLILFRRMQMKSARKFSKMAQSRERSLFMKTCSVINQASVSVNLVKYLMDMSENVVHM